jgi:uncharacterized RDD family membrane protein YckC
VTPSSDGTQRRAGGAVIVPHEYTVLTPERVRLQYDIAGIGSRSAAAIVDVVIQVVAWLLLLFAFFAGLGALGSADVLSENDVLVGVLVAVVILVSFFILWGYYLVFEIAWSGQTPGKRLLGLRVIRENGYPLRAGDAVVRNLIRIVDGPPVMSALGLLVMLLNQRSRRLGDYAAGTVVVREGARRTLAVAMAEAAPSVDRTLPSLLTEDATLLRDFLVRRAALRPAPRADIARRLADVLARRYGLDGLRGEGATDEQFLERLVETG